MADAEILSAPDEFPARPTDMLRIELHRYQLTQKKKRIYNNVLLSITYFIFGLGLGLYGPLYPLQANIHRIPSYIYGIIISFNFFIALLFYPVASIMVPSVTCKESACLSMLIIGCCRVLFGVLALSSHKLYFILLFIAIQIIDGIGIAILLVSTFVILFSEATETTNKNSIWIIISAVFGICVGPVCGEVVTNAFGFSVSFYGTGILSILDAVFLAVFLPEPGQKLTYNNIPIISWSKKPGMIIYFFAIFTTFNYYGFLNIVLEPYLQQFHLHIIFVGLMFSLTSLSCALSAPVWKWLTAFGFNSLLLSCFASIYIFISLILIVPASFTGFNQCLTYLSISLLLQGIGNGGKLACILYAAQRDQDSRRRFIEPTVSLPLIIPTMFIFSSFFGFFSGCVIISTTLHFFGLSTSSYYLYGLEVVCVALSFTYAFQRNYTAPRKIMHTEESRVLLEN